VKWRLVSGWSAALILLLEFAFFALVLAPRQGGPHTFANFDNVALILKYSSIYGIAAIGAAMIIGAGGIDLAILDGEATPEGGMGLAKQLKDEIDDGPPIVVLTGRRDDAWLAAWSRAEGAVPHPIDPIRLSRTVLELLRTPVQ